MLFFPLILLAMDNQDDKAFMAKVYEDNRVLMYKIAYKVLHDRHDVEDAIGETCLRLIEKVEVLRQLECCKLTAYVVSSIRNVSINLAIKHARNDAHVFLTDEEDLREAEARADTHPEAHVLQVAQKDELKRALMRLPEKERMILVMKYVDGLDDAQIAAVLRISPGSVRTYLTRARRHAREAMKGEAE
ncbi:MAG: sigma-70 family RNA polymerase sigma factor [Clostridia bacterium]